MKNKKFISITDFYSNQLFLNIDYIEEISLYSYQFNKTNRYEINFRLSGRTYCMRFDTEEERDGWVKGNLGSLI